MSILAASGAGFLSAVVFSFLFTSTIRSRLYSCECDLADLQDRHLRTVRRDAAKNRWDKEDEIDVAIEGKLGAAPQKKEWKKWPSSDRLANS